MTTSTYVGHTVFPVLPLLVAVVGAWIRTRHSTSPAGSTRDLAALVGHRRARCRESGNVSRS
jgi:hypothetical protein